MTDEKHNREGQAGAPAKDPARDERKNPREHRLKLALRENLKRRKSQARGRSDEAHSNIASSIEDERSRDKDSQQPSGKKPGG